MSLAMLSVLILPYHSRSLELTKLYLDRTGCDLNKRSRETVFLAVAIAVQVTMHVKLRPPTDMNNPHAAIY